MKAIAIIPARSGSKGLKDKNIKLLNGKPLIYYSIKAALDSKCFDEVYVSTDSEKYRKIAIECGASVPFLRCAENAGDTSSSWDVVRECLLKYKEKGMDFGRFMLLQPTSPMRTKDDIRESFKTMKEENADTVLGIVEVEHSPLHCVELSDSMDLSKMVSSKYFKMRRQDLPTFYRLNGAIYLSNVDTFLERGSVYEGRVFGYAMPKERSVDIDTAFDFKVAEILMQEQESVEKDC